ncbi:MAG: hypothetical protein ACK4YQ_11955 [Phenylobacterium sp.]|uniref:hypothetical protein n=1 Tax=Phenylobacterium sp. TaxID=1871053 RepID=UPI00391C99CA
MPIMVKYAAPHITRDVYESIRQALDWDHHPPEGALLHVVAFDEAGGLESFDIWESQRHLDAYAADRLAGVLKDLGLPEATPEHFEIAVAAASPEMAQFVLPAFQQGSPAAFGSSESRSFQPPHVPERPI